ncbi:hypothetical protein ES703_76953 [subsurface metagenome]
MSERKLKNPPVLEALFELKWRLQDKPFRTDPHYKILIGSMYDKLKSEYPFHEQLPASSIPDELVGYVIQHRFRKDQNQWPLIQLGPGIIVLNDTQKYSWSDFSDRISKMLEALFASYPDADKNLDFNSSLLRYINAIPFNYDEKNIFQFVKERLKVTVDVVDKLFEDTGVNSSPSGINLGFTFPSNKPPGSIRLQFNRGKIKDSDALIWETYVQSLDKETPKNIDTALGWADTAHILSEDWFFKLVKGELLRRFE